MKVMPRCLRTVSVYARPARRLLYAAEHPVEPDPHFAAEGDPDDAGAAFDVAEGNLPDAAFDAAVRGIVAVVAHHEDAALFHHEGAGTLEDGILALQDGMPVAAEVLEIHARDHVDVGVCVLGVVLV